MRFKEIIEAKEDPYYWMAKPTDPYKSSQRDPLLFRIIQREAGPNKGKVIPEIEALKGKDGMFAVDRVSDMFVQDLMKKYPSTLFGAFYDTSTSPNAYQDYKKAVQENKQEIIKELEEWNSTRHYDNRFYYPNRPYDQDALLGYRGDERTGQVENTAKKFDPKDMQFYLSGYKWAVGKRLIDPVPADQWCMIVLVEGRDDFGFNIGNYVQNLDQNPTAKKFDQQVKTMGLTNDWQRGFVCLLKQKQDIVKKTGMNFYQAWNGGTQNVGRYQAQAKAVKDPRNKPLLDAIAGML